MAAPHEGGWLWKRGMGRTTFGGTSWQRRYLECSSTKLLWFDKDPANRGGAKEKGGMMWTNVVMVVPVCNADPRTKEILSKVGDGKFPAEAGGCPAEVAQIGIVFKDVEKGTSVEILLLRAETGADRADWLRRLVNNLSAHSHTARICRAGIISSLSDLHLGELCEDVDDVIITRAELERRLKEAQDSAAAEGANSGSSVAAVPKEKEEEWAQKEAALKKELEEAKAAKDAAEKKVAESSGSGEQTAAELKRQQEEGAQKEAALKKELEEAKAAKDAAEKKVAESSGSGEQTAAELKRQQEEGAQKEAALKKELEEAKAAKDAAEKKVAELTNDVEEARRAAAAKGSAEGSALQKQLDDLKQALARSEAATKEAEAARKSEVDNLQGELATAKKEVLDAADKLRQAGANHAAGMESSSAARSNLEAEIATLKSQLADAAKRHEATVDASQKLEAELQQQRATGDSATKEALAKYEAEAAKVGLLTKEIELLRASLEREVQSLRENLATAEGQAATLSKSLNEAESRVRSTQQQLQDSKAECSGVSEKLTAADARAASLEVDLQSARKDVDRQKDETKAMKAAVDKKDAELAAMKKRIKALGKPQKSPEMEKMEDTIAVLQGLVKKLEGELVEKDRTFEDRLENERKSINAQYMAKTRIKDNQTTVTIATGGAVHHKTVNTLDKDLPANYVTMDEVRMEASMGSVKLNTRRLALLEAERARIGAPLYENNIFSNEPHLVIVACIGEHAGYDHALRYLEVEASNSIKRYQGGTPSRRGSSLMRSPGTPNSERDPSGSASPAREGSRRPFRVLGMRNKIKDLMNLLWAGPAVQQHCGMDLVILGNQDGIELAMELQRMQNPTQTVLLYPVTKQSPHHGSGSAHSAVDPIVFDYLKNTAPSVQTITTEAKLIDLCCPLIR